SKRKPTLLPEAKAVYFSLLLPGLLGPHPDALNFFLYLRRPRQCSLGRTIDLTECLNIRHTVYSGRGRNGIGKGRETRCHYRTRSTAKEIWHRRRHVGYCRGAGGRHSHSTGHYSSGGKIYS